MALGPLMIDIEGTSLTPVDRELIREPAVGGIILFTRNFESVAQITELIKEIKSLRQPSVLVAADQEGGRVQRFREGFTALPPVGFFGLRYDADPDSALRLVRRTGWLLAAELLAVGVDLNFGPVLDVDHGVSEIVGDRALHRDPDVVARLAIALMAGMKAAGMAAVGKHFPGHGAVVADSHHELPSDRREYADITGDLGVFERLVRAGLPGIMTAHVAYPELDPLPASFSRWWISSELRERIGFRGAVFSDDLSMLATEGFGSIGERVGLAILGTARNRPG